jgi:hypothetical protein
MIDLAKALGFEPRLTVLETVVLPLTPRRYADSRKGDLMGLSPHLYSQIAEGTSR